MEVVLPGRAVRMLLHCLSAVAVAGALIGDRQDVISPPVTLTASSTNVELCTVDQDFLRVKLRLDVRVRTSASGPMIVPRNPGLVYYHRYARTIDVLGTRKWDHIGWISSNERPVFGSRPDARFVILSKTREHSSAVEVDLFLHRDFLSERLFFQLVFGGLDLHPEEAEVLRRRWQKFGTLHAGTLRTEPFSVALPTGQDFRSCADIA
jgi:hypothetical protein